MGLCGLTCVAEAVGAVSIVYYAVKFILWIRTSYFVKCDYVKRYGAGSWAVVTGASDGIGRALAIGVARRGLNVVLISRTKSKLDEVAATIAAKASGVKVVVIPVDFATAKRGDYEELVKTRLSALDVSVLINNVGVSYECPTPFAESSVEENERVIQVNAVAPTTLTRLLLPQLKQRGRGGIINLSSVTGWVPTPLLTVYSATKAYNRLFSLSLAGELRSDNIDVLTVDPAFVVTNMSKIRRSSFFNVDPAPMASHVLNKLGYVTETSGHRHHDMNTPVMGLLPTSVIYSQMLAVQQRALRKKDK